MVTPSLSAEAGQSVNLPVRVEPAEGIVPSSYVVVRGLPQGATLNRGYSIDLGVWVINVRALEKVELQLPRNEVGRLLISFDLVTSDGTVSSQGSLALTIVPVAAAGMTRPETPRSVLPPVPAESPQISRPLAAPPQIAVPQPPPSVTASQPEAVKPTPAVPAPATLPLGRYGAAPNPNAGLKELQRGRDLLKGGDIRAARLFFRRAAEAGNPDAALVLGSTYDPNTMRGLGVIGMDPDANEARKWYEEAERLGLPQARSMISALPTDRN